MNAAQIHLALNHAPLFLSIIGAGLLVTGMLRKNETLKPIALFLFVAAALFTAPVFLTGEGTEEMVEHLPGVNEGYIEQHEDMAKISMVIIAVTGLIALVALLFRKRGGLAKMLYGISLVLSLASFGTMAWTAHLGGLIRHTELQNGAVAAEQEKEAEDDD